MDTINEKSQTLISKHITSIDAAIFIRKMQKIRTNKCNNEISRMYRVDDILLETVRQHACMAFCGMGLETLSGFSVYIIMLIHCC